MIHVTRVQRITQNLEHNNYSHVQQVHHVVTIAISAYLTQDVVAPPPALLLTSLDLYEQSVNSASGVVASNGQTGSAVPATAEQ